MTDIGLINPESDFEVNGPLISPFYPITIDYAGIKATGSSFSEFDSSNFGARYANVSI